MRLSGSFPVQSVTSNLPFPIRFRTICWLPPVYTRPAEYKGWRVPDILLSGHERKIAEWRLEQAQERTRRLRPDLLDSTFGTLPHQSS